MRWARPPSELTRVAAQENIGSRALAASATSVGFEFPQRRVAAIEVNHRNGIDDGELPTLLALEKCTHSHLDHVAESVAIKARLFEAFPHDGVR
jgi:hypothetical protein